ncbi:MAG: aminotransferase class I/II-fold pyridoxal phosphate-dependent enzyme [Flavobacteriaceae bacterium]|nr:aminotransferase class I/II-fold pyridoxal phosphate-dependent enzyme [Flavobacteriaceae bacterium]
MYFRNVRASKLPNQGLSIFTVMSALAAKHNAINLSQGFPEFNPPDDLIRKVNESLLIGRNQYSPMAGQLSLREVIAERQNAWGRSFEINPDTDITIVPGATAGLFATFQALVQHGDEVIIFDPSYDSYAPAIALAGGIPIRIPLNQDFSMPWEQLKSKLSNRTVMIVVNTPHNPLGLVFSQSDWLELARIIQNTDILVLSDEVYEHMVFDEKQHVSVLQIPALANQAIAISSFGKTFHATGWKLGYVTAKAELSAEIRKVYQFLAFAANTPMQFAAAEFLLQNPSYENSVSEIMQAKRNYFAEGLSQSRFQLLPCEGAYFQIVDYSIISDLADIEFANLLTTEHKVAGIPVSAFYQNPNPNQRLLRFCFAKNNDTLQKSLDILCRL